MCNPAEAWILYVRLLHAFCAVPQDPRPTRRRPPILLTAGLLLRRPACQHRNVAAHEAAPAATGAGCALPASLRIVALMTAAMVHIAAAANHA